MSEKPCRKCVECIYLEHHPLFESYASEEPNHRAAKAGFECWYSCKHCDAFVPNDDGDTLDELMDRGPLSWH